MTDIVRVRVPATSANLGPGFDCLGLALGINVDITVNLREPAKEASHPLAPMAASAARAAFRSIKGPEPGQFAVEVHGDIPIARGLGASAAARVGGVVAANALMGDPLVADDVLGIAAALEGHADNAAPALRGGLQVAVRDNERWTCLRIEIPEGLGVALLVPDLEMPTQESRRLLPARISRDDAVFNASRVGLLVAALSQGRWDMLSLAVQDRLHQSARAALFPAMFDIFEAALAAGALASYLSGSGSTVAALVIKDADAVAAAMLAAASRAGYSGRTLVTATSSSGAHVVA